MKDLFKVKGTRYIAYLVAFIVLLIIFFRVYSTSAVIGNVEKNVISYYIENYDKNANPEELTARNINFGCHTELHVYENDELVSRFIYRFGRFSKVG